MRNIALFFFLCLSINTTAQRNIFVSPSGNDQNPGSLKHPLRTLEAAIHKASGETGEKVNVWLRGGTYYLQKTVRIDAADFGASALRIAAWQKETVFVSAGVRLYPVWKHDGQGPVLVTRVPGGASFERLYVNGQLQVLARYPNENPYARIYQGTSPDALAPARVKRWKDPKGGYVHALHAGEWGSFDYLITGVNDNGELTLEGGWQNNRPSPMHKTYRFVENIREELDTVGEWYLDRANHLLYYYPPLGLDLARARVEASLLKNSIELHGTAGQPLQNIRLQDLHFIHNERSFMDTREPIVRSDWTIYRGGAVLMDGTAHCSIVGCTFTGLGGNGVMVSDYNRQDTVRECLIAHIGASAICFIGDTGAARSPAFRYEDFIPYEQMDKTPGPRTENYPSACLATDNLIHDVGEIEKQGAGVEIDLASSITVSHNSIYDVPRAGINIGDGCWGGHLLEYNDVFNTVLETGDHGAFNSWGRDRFWAADRSYMDSLVRVHPALVLLDAQKADTIRYNRFRCDHGWDIDLDDGSTNYRIYANVCLNGGIKLREGFYRIVENNILINNSLHPHVWFKNDGDVFRHNIVTRGYYPIQIEDWGQAIDSNLFPDSAALSIVQARGTDRHSIAGNPLFADAARGNYTVSPHSPALAMGFRNFRQDDFGVRDPALRRVAGRPEIPVLVLRGIARAGESQEAGGPISFLGGKIKSVETLGERSAYGLPDQTGVIVLSAGNGLLYRSGLRDGDVIISIPNTQAILALKGRAAVRIDVIRNQQPLVFDLILR